MVKEWKKHPITTGLYFFRKNKFSKKVKLYVDISPYSDMGVVGEFRFKYFKFFPFLFPLKKGEYQLIKYMAPYFTLGKRYRK